MQLSLAVIYTQLIVSSDIAPASTATVGKMKNGKMKSSMFSLRLFLQCQILPCFLSSTKRHLSHLINKTFLRYNMWCYYFQTFHKEILHDGESRILFPAAISLQTPTLVMPLTLSTSPFSCPAIPKTYNFLPK